jgi:hypothetical protein
MSSVRRLGVALSAAAIATMLSACAQAPVDPLGRKAAMEAHMKAMHDMHERMSRAGTPEECRALMADHMALMQQGMAMMEMMKDRTGAPAAHH